MRAQTNIIVAEPSGLIFSGLVTVTGNSGRGITLIRAESADEIQRLVTLREVETVIVNPSMVTGNVRVIQGIRNSSPGTRLIALVYAFFDENLLSLFDARMSITDSPEKILAAIAGDVSGSVSPDPSPVSASLSDREVEVLKLLASGMATKEIADVLHISTNTVITHRKNLSSKTGIRSVSGLAVYAVVKKYINPGSINN
jgi:DNA-binding NarL/FixJ family response regulator